MSYSTKKQERIERYKRRAEKADQESTRLWDDAGKMASVIPFGQPILVGHHSEQRDRNFRDRIHNKQRKSVELSEKAEYWEQRAESAEKNNSISSDDPEAVQKLKEKIKKAEEYQETMKEVNKIVWMKIDDEEKIARLHEKFSWKLETCEKLLIPDFCGRAGMPDYALTNNSANIRRMKERLEELKQREGQETTSKTHGNIEVIENVEENRIQIVFPGKPGYETRSILKRNGFRWSPRNMAWQRHLNNAGRYAAECVMKKIMEEK